MQHTQNGTAVEGTFATRSDPHEVQTYETQSHALTMKFA